MEQFWRRAGVLLGKYWWLVLGAVVVVTAALVPGLTRLEFATGQDSYLNSDSQESIDNVEFQDQFGGETVILLFSATDDSDVAELFSGSNLAELERLTAELEQVPEVEAAITPVVSLQFSDALIRGAGRDALLAAAQRDPDPDGQAARNADIAVGLARLGAVANQEIGDPEWADLLIYGCNLAATAEGESLVNALARLTSADVAASDDLTGSAKLGGDWELEYRTGTVESGMALSTTAQASLDGVLADADTQISEQIADGLATLCFHISSRCHRHRGDSGKREDPTEHGDFSKSKRFFSKRECIQSFHRDSFADSLRH